MLVLGHKRGLRAEYGVGRGVDVADQPGVGVERTGVAAVVACQQRYDVERVEIIVI